ncbi:MAG: hypothetical protein QM757_29030 [Paludibaculum sp.]
MTEMATVRVLLVSEAQEDHAYLRHLLADPRDGLPADCRWVLYSSHSVPSALGVLADHQIPIVLSECELGPDTWRSMLGALASFPRPPLLIVVSRLDDECLWSEALNLGVYDVLAKPLAAEEVLRILGQAWLEWKQRHAAKRSWGARYKTVAVP